MTQQEPSEINILDPEMQIRFWARLQLLRNEYLGNALSRVIGEVGVLQTDHELAEFVGPTRLTALGIHALRGEVFYPVPVILKAAPMLLGYYRLLYGFSQKQFYHKANFGRFQAMEKDNRLSPMIEAGLTPLCESLIETGWRLFSAVSPISLRSIHELQLLTLGPQFRGTENNIIGQGATSQVFNLIRELISDYITASSDQVITLRNDSGRTVQIAFAPDPDITMIQTLETGAIPSVSVEIKGGGDRSNVHNRMGEAEKSHQKAKAAGFRQFWTILKADIDLDVARRESPTTDIFFSLDEILDRDSQPHKQFRDLLRSTIGTS